MSSGTLSIILTVLGVACVILAFAVDAVRCRFRRRRRCPKCWYDMSHSPGLTCSECGFAASSERRLLRFRRRWRYALLAPLLFAGAWTSHRWPQIEARGWPAAIPTTALFSSVWYVETPPHWDVIDDLPCCGSPPPGGRPTYPISLYKYVATRCNHELGHRFDDETPSQWQQRLLAGRILNALDDADPFITRASDAEVGDYLAWALEVWGLYPLLNDDQLERGFNIWPVRIRCRPQWPVGMNVYAELDAWRPFGPGSTLLEFLSDSPSAFPLSLHYSWSLEGAMISFMPGPYLWHDQMTRVATSGRGSANEKIVHLVRVLRYTQPFGNELLFSPPVHPESVVPIYSWSRKVEWPIEFVPSIDDVLTPVRSEAIDDVIRESFKAGLANLPSYLYDSQPELVVLPETLKDTLVDHGSPCLAATLTVVSDGVDVAVASAWWHVSVSDYDGGWHMTPSEGYCTIPLEYAEGVGFELLNTSTLTLRITSDPELALRCFDADRYWEGEIEIPLPFINGPDPIRALRDSIVGEQ